MNYKLGIAILFVRDVAAERKFYAETLGLPLIREGSSDNFILFGTAGDGFVALQNAASIPGGKASPAGGSQLGLVVDDVDAVYRDWQAKGVELISAPQDFPFGRAFDARDPEGHLLNVYKPRPEWKGWGL
ncbi:MAG TPA: VOC family protein [Anaerolineae bacterium]|nr:VOC family protein [Anaerolineae bacterium]